MLSLKLKKTEEPMKEHLLNSYVKFAEFLVHALGSCFGAVVYSVDSEGQSGTVIGVFGVVTDRQPGDPMSHFVSRVLQTMKKKNLPELIHVDTEASTSGGRIKLAFYPIRDASGKIIGIFVLYATLEMMYGIRNAINEFMGYSSNDDSRNKVISVIDDENQSLTKYMLQQIRDEIDAYGIPPQRMTMEEKKQIVQSLEKKEVFYVKDSVKMTANLLGVSIPTVYRLLKRD
jgi:predicted transcriptional regulator YheO